MSTERKTNKYNPLAFLDPLRFIGAIVIATFVHSTVVFYGDNPFCAYLVTHGGAFVEMFFIASGLMFFLFYFQRILSKKMTYKDFAINRASRLLPIVLFSIIVTFIGYLIMTYYNGSIFLNPNLLDFAISLFFGSPDIFGSGGVINGVLWYICVLIFCYLLAILFTFIKERSKMSTNLLFIIPIIVSIFLIYASIKNPNFGFDSHIPRGLLAFFMGFYLGEFIKKFDTFKSKTKIISRIIALCFIAIFIVTMSVPITAEYNSNPLEFRVVSGLMFFIPLFVLLYDVRWLNNLFSHKVFKVAGGGLSLPIYVFNGFCCAISVAIVGGDNNAQFIGGWFWLVMFVVHIAISLGWYYGDKLVRTRINKIKKN